MSALVRAELLKQRSTRMWAWLLLATLVLMVIGIMVNVPSRGATNSALSIDDPDLLAHILGDILAVPAVTMLLLGVLSFTQETRYGTITPTFLVEPRRRRALTAKGIALVLTSVLISMVAAAVAAVTAIAAIHVRHGNITFGTQFCQVVAALFAVMALYSVMGLAVGALVRSQIVAVVAALVWLLFAERLLIAALPNPGRWTASGATIALLQAGATSSPGPTLSAPAGGLLLAAYTALLAALALLITPQRDVI